MVWYVQRKMVNPGGRDGRETDNGQVGWWKLDHLEVPNESLLCGKHLCGYVNGLKALAEGASNSEEEEFQETVDEAHMLITMAISKIQMYPVTSCEIAVKSWDEVNTHFECNTRKNFMLLMRKLFKLEMAEDGSLGLEEHFR